MSLPVIEVRYDGAADMPTVVVPEELKDKVTVRMVDSSAEDQLIGTHNGISVYMCTKDDMLAECWASTQPHTDWDSEQAFDLRDLPAIPQDLEAKYEQLFPGDENSQSVAYAIDCGVITEEGLNGEQDNSSQYDVAK